MTCCHKVAVGWHPILLQGSHRPAPLTISCLPHSPAYLTCLPLNRQPDPLVCTGFHLAPQDVRASSLNCYLFEALEGDSTETRASLITQQLALADPCTFRLVVKVRGVGLQFKLGREVLSHQ